MCSAQCADQSAYTEWRKDGVSWRQQWRLQWRKQSAMLLGERGSWLSSNTNGYALAGQCLPTDIQARVCDAAARGGKAQTRRKLGVSLAYGRRKQCRLGVIAQCLGFAGVGTARHISI